MLLALLACASTDPATRCKPCASEDEAVAGDGADIDAGCPGEVNDAEGLVEAVEQGGSWLLGEGRYSVDLVSWAEVELSGCGPVTLEGELEIRAGTLRATELMVDGGWLVTGGRLVLEGGSTTPASEWDEALHVTATDGPEATVLATRHRFDAPVFVIHGGILEATESAFSGPGWALSYQYASGSVIDSLVREAEVGVRLLDSDVLLDGVNYVGVDIPVEVVD